MRWWIADYHAGGGGLAESLHASLHTYFEDKLATALQKDTFESNGVVQYFHVPGTSLSCSGFHVFVSRVVRRPRSDVSHTLFRHFLAENKQETTGLFHVQHRTNCNVDAVIGVLSTA